MDPKHGGACGAGRRWRWFAYALGGAGRPSIRPGLGGVGCRAFGPPLQHKTWNLSSVWSFPSERGRMWLKSCTPFMAHEAAVLGGLGSDAVPHLVASSGQRLLMSEMGGVDGHEATVAETCELLDRLIELQVQNIPRTSALVAAGVPQRTWGIVTSELDELVNRLAPGDRRLRKLVENAREKADVIASCRLPDVLVHGDAHPGNARLGAAPTWFDWGECFIGHPLIDLGVLDRRTPDDRAILTDYWLAAWAKAVPGSEPHRAWPLVRPMVVLRGAWIYQMFLDNIERSEHIYHINDVTRCLAAAAALGSDS